MTVLFGTLRYVQETTRAQFERSDRVTISLLDDLARIAILTDDYAELHAFIEETRDDTRLKSVALSDLSGRIVAASNPSLVGDLAAATLFPSDEMSENLRLRTIQLGSLGSRVGTLFVEFNHGELTRTLNEAYRRGFLIAISGMVVIASVGLATGHLLTRRLTRLAKVADRVADGETKLRVETRGRDEVARVGIAVNHMLDRLEAQIHDVTLTRDRLYLPTEAMHDAFAIWSADGRLLLSNRRFGDIFRLDSAELDASADFKSMAWRTAERLVDLEGRTIEEWYDWRLATRRQGSASVEVGLKDGRWIQIEEQVLEDGGVVSIYTEITDAKKREQALVESQEHLQLVMNSVGEGIATLDVNGTIEGANKAMEGLFERPAHEMIGQPIQDFLNGGSELFATWVAQTESEPSAGAGPARHDAVARRFSGSFPVEIAFNRVIWRNRPVIIATLRDVTEQHEAHSTILHQATHDTLTGLPNRTLIDDRLDQAIAKAARDGRNVAALFLDLDHFKSINDTLGHSAGDELLVQIAERLQCCVRSTDTIARMGGDEFLIVISDLERPQEALKPARKILQALRLPLNLQGRETHIRASLGIAFYPIDSEDRAQLLKHADIALYRAKEHGRNRFELFDATMRDQATERANLENDLRKAVVHEELFLVYQPQIDIASGQSIGLEALIRWDHPRHGQLLPGQFIPLAEECGLIGELGSWALRKACEDLINWRRRGLAIARVAVNVSPKQLNEDLFDQVAQNLERAGLEPNSLELELTETALIQDRQPTLKAIKRLRKLGVGMALDDFGTGFSSLSHLRNYPIQRVKVDQAFVRDLASDRSDEAVVRAVIGLSHGLGMRVVAEGIETAEQLEMLRQLGCDEGQGFLFAHPRRAEEILESLACAAE